MRGLGWIIGVPLAIIAIIFAVANRQMAEIRFWPLPFEAALPVYLLALGAVLIGLAVGALLVWLGQHHWRAEAKGGRRHIRRLERENAELKAQQAKPATEEELGTMLHIPASSTLEQPNTETQPPRA